MKIIKKKLVSYLDLNNLYGWVMNSYLPNEGFEWLEDPETFDVRLVTRNSNIRYILEVDIEYPEELHDIHNDYPYCAEQVIVKEDMLSDTEARLIEKCPF